AVKPEPIKRNCIKIKIVPAVVSKCHPEWQFIDALAPSDACIAKGMIPTAECPCRWRSGIVNEQNVVVPPAIYLWPVVNIATGCGNPWSSGSPFAKCMAKGVAY
ncbi:hypothetical protein LDC_0530, partial [sediment metagenome]